LSTEEGLGPTSVNQEEYSATKGFNRASLLMPFPQFGDVNIQEPIDYGWYHSLQLRLEARPISSL
jgi:hypothetical protein